MRLRSAGISQRPCTRVSSGRLFQAIRGRRGLNYGDYAYIEAFPRGMFAFFPDPNVARRAQLFEIWIRPVKPENAPLAIRLALDQLQRMVGEGIPAEDFERTREYLIKNAHTMAARQGNRLGMALDAGGHLTHGARVNLSGRYFDAVAYGLDPATEEIDYKQVEELAHVKKPKLIVTGASAYSLVIDWKRFRAIADRIGALLMADIAHYAGLIAAGLYPSPIGIADFVTTTTHKTLRGPRGGMILANAEHEKVINSAVFPMIQGGPLMHVIAAKAVALKEAMSKGFRQYQEQVLDNARVMAKTLQERGFRIVSGRTECHMFLVDLRGKKITGREAEIVLGSANITVNKNAVPNDPQKPMITSGVRIGSPAMTTRGFKELEAEQLAHLIADVLESPADEKVIKRVTAEVKKLCAKFPVYRR